MAVREKSLQGDGLEPVVGGDDHLPASSKIDCENQYSIEWLYVYGDLENSSCVLLKYHATLALAPSLSDNVLYRCCL